MKHKRLKQLQKHMNIDLKILQNWLKVNKISLNAEKTEFILFRNSNKKVDYDFKIKINGKILSPSEYVKYLGFLNWHFHYNALSIKLYRAYKMLSKIIH